MDGSPLTNNTGLTGVRSAAPHVVIPLTGGKVRGMYMDRWGYILSGEEG